MGGRVGPTAVWLAQTKLWVGFLPIAGPARVAMALFGNWLDMRIFTNILDVRMHFGVTDEVWAAFTSVVEQFNDD